MRFWNFWFNKTDLEKKYISTWELAEAEILRTPGNKDNIFSIYIGGSFPRRELRNNSDIDVYVVFNNLELVKSSLNKEAEGVVINDIKLGLNFYSYDELIKKRFECNRLKKFACAPILFLKGIDSCKKVYGATIDRGDVDKIYSDETALKNNIQNLRGYMGQNHGDHHMKAVSKQFFMVVYYEQKLLGEIKKPFSRIIVYESVKEIENHLIHKCQDIISHNEKYLNSPEKEKYLSQKQNLFIEITEYLKTLEQKFNLNI